jgi:cobalt-zinc-cadmium efflux system membrane fusion protein
MKFLNAKHNIIIAFLLFTPLSFSACSKSNAAQNESHEGHDHGEEGHEKGDHAEHEGHDHEKEEAHGKKNEEHGDEDREHEEEGHEGHGHGEDEAPDLDRPVSELFEENCEHNMKAHECDECRYEVGVVKARTDLFEGGLLTTVRAEQRSTVLPLRITGEVQFDERRVARIGTQVQGVVRKVHVTLGDKVTEGQALLEIESVEVGNTKAAYQEALAMEELARQNYDRIESLQKEGISSQKEMLLAKQELKAAKIRANVARGTLKRLGMTGSKKRGVSLNNSSGKLVLRAPSDGTVLGVNAVSGEVARTEEPLVTIGDNALLWVWADLYENDYARVAAGQAKDNLHAEVTVKAFPKRKFAGKVDFVSPAMSESSRTIKVRISVPNPDGELLAGMFADVDLFLPGSRQSLALPKDAVLEDEGRSFVFIHHKGDYFVRRPVNTGRSFPGFVEVKQGLEGQEAVVANGAFLLKSDVLRSKMGAGCAD